MSTKTPATVLKLFLAAVLGGFGWETATAAPAIQTWNTPTGSRVYFVPAPELPMVDIRLVFDAASSRDGSLPGLASLTNSLLTEGAGPWNADQIAQRLESVGAEISASSLRDMALVSVRSLTDQPLLDVAVDTLETVLARPRFEPDDFERIRAQMKTAVRLGDESPSEVAERAFYAAVFTGHPYAMPSEGTVDSLDSLTREDVIQHHRRYYVARNATVAIVGALTRQQAEDVARRVTAGLAEGDRPAELPPVPKAKSTFQRIDFPSTQSHIFVGQPGMTRDDADYFPLYVGNHILGGSGLVSQLSEEVREKRGLSYSVYSYFVPMRRPGPFLMGLQTQNEKAEEALGVLNATLAKFVESGPTAEELNAAKQNLTGGFPLRIASNSNIVENLAMIGFYDLPLDYLDTFVSKVNAVTSEQIRDAFRRRIDAGRFVTVIVGDNSNKTAAADNP